MNGQIVGLDVGGANIKLACSDGTVQARAFPLWREPHRLTDVLSDMLQFAQDDAQIVATMTGELADCFPSKQQGVEHIVTALETAVGARSLHVYLTGGEFVAPNLAKQQYQQAAASNWHALANFVSRQPDWGNCLLIDIGSTTCDVIPIVDGCVAAKGKTDTQRLLAGELVYVGSERTSIAMLTGELPYRNQMCSVAREMFATTLDVALTSNHQPDRPGDCDTADGRPACREFAVARLGRCVCADHDEWTDADARVAATHVEDRIAELLWQATQKVYSAQPDLQNAPLVVSGHGDWLLEPLLRQELRSVRVFQLRDSMGIEAARSAPAHALVYLAERIL